MGSTGPEHPTTDIHHHDDHRFHRHRLRQGQHGLRHRGDLPRRRLRGPGPRLQRRRRHHRHRRDRRPRRAVPGTVRYRRHLRRTARREDCRRHHQPARLRHLHPPPRRRLLRHRRACRAAAEAHVLKAFNVNFAATLAAKANGSEPTTVLVAGDDAAAKESFSATVTAGGLRVLDAGALSRARELEATALLQMGLAAAGQISWTNGFAVVK